MTTRAPFLKTRYSGYHHRHIPPEDTELTHVGPGHPVRRIPAPLLAAGLLLGRPGELPLARQNPRRGTRRVSRLERRVGLLERHCPHRGTSLEFGLIGDRGIRCCYHGWLFDVDGTILETPGEPPTSTLKDRLCHGAYPAHRRTASSSPTWGRPISSRRFPTTTASDRPGYR